jgi:hypothetical protein
MALLDPGPEIFVTLAGKYEIVAVERRDAWPPTVAIKLSLAPIPSADVHLIVLCATVTTQLLAV